MNFEKFVGTNDEQTDSECLRNGLALLVGWKARRFEEFLEVTDHELERWWATSEPQWASEQYAFLTKNQRTKLRHLHERGPQALLNTVRKWPGQIITCDQQCYPSALMELRYPPAGFHVVGNTALLQDSGIAVVGSRKIDVASASSARRILESSVAKGLTIISGGALGSDALAHRCAVDFGGQTMAVLPSGLQSLSPKSNQRLFAEIASGSGLLLSEYPPRQGVRRYHFKRRNSLIAALSRGVLVLRAGKKSGTQLTVDAARKLDRPLAAMPGPAGDPLSWGCHEIIRSGGQLIARPEDLWQWWSSLVPDAFEEACEQREGTDIESVQPVRPDCPVLDKAVELLDSEGAFSIEGLARETGKTAAELQTVLLGHELSGIIERIVGGDRFRFR